MSLGDYDIPIQSKYFRKIHDYEEFSTEEFQMLEDYIHTSASRRHKFRPDVNRIFKVVNYERAARYQEKKRELGGDANPTLLFDGTREKNLNKILGEGFKPGKKGMFGPGMYFAKNSSKSAQEKYTGRGPDEYVWLLLCEVLLGREKIVHKARPFMDGEELHRQGYHSIYAKRTPGDGSKRVWNDEYVVFDKDQIYPLYVVEC